MVILPGEVMTAQERDQAFIEAVKNGAKLVVASDVAKSLLAAGVTVGYEVSEFLKPGTAVAVDVERFIPTLENTYLC